MQRDELLADYDAARTELDRANLEAFMIRRRIRQAQRWVTETERALTEAGVKPYRPQAPRKCDQGEAA
ncbi:MULTISPECIES: hypothetical protein [Streptomyces]|uniref:Transcriptional regulator n=2 Tax=Streptomyces TaxID=1883 RepID=A0ABV9IVG3_9ACTN